MGVAVQGAAPPPSPGAGGGRGGRGGAGRRGYVRRRLPGTGPGARPGGAAMGATSSGPGPAPAPVRHPQVRAAASAPGIPPGHLRPGVPSLTLSPVPQGRAVGSWVRALLSRAGSVPVSVPVPVPGLALAPRGPAEEPPLPGWPLPQLVSLFLPEFPVRPSARQQQLKVPSRSPHPPNGVPVHPNGVPDRPPPGASCPCIPPLAPCTVSPLVLPGFLHVSTGVSQRPEHPPEPSVHPVPPSRHRRVPYRALLARFTGSLRVLPPSPAVPPAPLLSPPCARVEPRCVLPGFLCTPPSVASHRGPACTPGGPVHCVKIHRCRVGVPVSQSPVSRTGSP